MMKKALFVLALALQFVAASGYVQAHDPLPSCDPCPWVR
jgi:hypothetical protein